MKKDIVLKRNTAFGITLVYLFLGGFWIVLLQYYYYDTARYPWIFDGIRSLYVLITALILHTLIWRSHKALLNARQDYTKLVELGREPIIIHKNLEIIYCSKYALQLYGARDERDLLGKSIFDFVHPDYQQVAFDRIGQVSRGMPTELMEIKVLQINGAAIDVEIVDIPIEHGGKPAVQVIMRDITRRKQAENQIQEMLREFRVIESNIADFIAILDVKGLFTYVSPSHEKFFGRPLEKTGNRYIPPLPHPDDSHYFKQAYLEMIEFHEDMRVEVRVEHGQGSWLDVEVYGSPISESDSSDAVSILVIRDITERKESERLLRQSEKLSVLGQLSAGLAHEVRNPLTVLQGFLQMSEASEVYNREYTKLMLSELERIDTIISEFLVLSKPHKTHISARDVRDILKSTIDFIQTQATLKNVQITSQFESTSVLVTCEVNHLKQVFINVLKNAIEASPQGGFVEVTVHKYNDHQLMVRIKDQGEGIPQAIIPQLGDPFFSTKEEGTGLGLMVTNKIVKDHGGTIRFDSVQNEGTTVEIMLPFDTSSLSQGRK